MVRQFRLLSVLLLALCAQGASADIYKCVDDSGHTTYTNDKPQNGQRSCVLMTRDQPVTTAPAQARRPAAAAPSPGNFPRVSPEDQKNRDSDRRKILETELETEQRALADARRELKEQEGVRNGDERNYQKYLDRIQRYKDTIALHERNVEAISKELARLK